MGSTSKFVIKSYIMIEQQTVLNLIVVETYLEILFLLPLILLLQLKNHKKCHIVIVAN